MSFAAAAARMDAEVDARLGDSIFYQQGGEPLPDEPIKAFLIFPNQGDDEGAAYDELAARRPRLKVARAQIPTVTMNDRIWGGDELTAAQLDNVKWRPTSKKPQVGGRYVIFDLQKVG